MSYNKDTDYQKLIDDAVKNGDYASASKYEQQRNEKIETEGLDYEKTNNYQIPSGVDGATYNKMNSTFTASDEQKQAQDKSNNALSNLEGLTSKENIISEDVTNALNKEFSIPSTVLEADRYLSEKLKQIQSGRTSYTDDINDLMEQIRGRDKFSYDVDTDPLFQQALASAMNSGKTAMQDTIGQASALTGGYGSTYATTAGNQAYNAFIEDAYNNLPQYYQMAMEAYQMEGDEMYRQLGMLNDADDKEFNRNVMAYDATYQHRNQVYNEAYSQYRDSKSDAFAMANLQLNEHGQRVSDAYNYYNATSNNADVLYAREFDKWNAEVSQATQYAQMLNSDYWNQTNFDEGVRQYEKTFAENVRQYDTSFAEQQRQYNESLAEQKRQHNEQMAYNYTALNKKGSGGGGGGVKSPTQTMMKDALEAYNAEGMAGLNKYLNSIPDTYDTNSIAQYVGEYGELPMEQRTYTKTTDTFNWWWGVDGNDVVVDQYGNEYEIDDLPESIRKDVTKLKKGESYTK